MRKWLTPVLVVVLLAAGCSDDDDDETTTADTSIEREAEDQAEADAGGEEEAAHDEEGTGAALVVTVVDNAFEPEALSATAGEAITLEAEKTGSNPHTLTIDELEVDIDLREEAAGSAEITPDAGEYAYYCKVHGDSMSGTLTVT